MAIMNLDCRDYPLIIQNIGVGLLRRFCWIGPQAHAPSSRPISGHLLTLLAQSVIRYFGDIQGVHPLQIELHPHGLGIDLHYDCRPAMSQDPLAYREVVRTPDPQTLVRKRNSGIEG